MWLVTVFCLSNEESSESTQTSGNTIRAILNVLPFTKNLQGTEKEKIVDVLQPVTRKLAHLSLYALGGVLAILYINTYALSEGKKILFGICFCFIYSISDEIHQMFVPR